MGGSLTDMAATMMMVYLAATVAIGLFYGKQNKDVQQYLVAKRDLGIGLIIALMLGELIAGAGTVGNAAEAFQIGFSSVWANWGMTIGCWMFVLLGICKFFRVLGEAKAAVSVPEGFRLLFGGRTALVLMAIFTLVYTIIFAMQPVAAGNVLGPMFNVDRVTMAVVSGAIMIAVTVTGGLAGLAWMNVLHSVVMYLAMSIVAWYSLNHAGGWHALATMLPGSYSSFAQPSLPTAIAWGLGTGFSFLCAATVGGVCFGAKTTKIAERGILIGSLLVVPFALLPALVGMSAKVHIPSIEARGALFAMANHLSPLMGGLASTAIIAAIFSSGPAFLLIISSTLTRDFYKGLLRPEATDKEQFVFSRVVVVVVGVVATCLGLRATSILNTLLNAFQIRSVAGVVLAVALHWRRVSEDAAFWSILVGGALAAAWQFAGSPFGIAPLWPSLAAGLLILVVLTLMSREPVSKGHRRYQDMARNSG